MKRWMIGGYDKDYSFDEFKDAISSYATAIKKTTEEILTDVKGIINNFNEGVK